MFIRFILEIERLGGFTVFTFVMRVFCGRSLGEGCARLCVALLLTVSSGLAVCDEVVDVDSLEGRVSLVGRMGHYETETPLTPAQIREIDAKGLFKTLVSAPVTANGRLTDHWFKIKIKKSSDRPESIVFDAGTTVLTRFSILFGSGFASAEGSSTPEVGIFHRNDEFPSECDRICGKFTIDAPGIYVVYVRAQSIYSVRLDASLWRQDDFERVEQRKNLLFGVGYGVICASILVGVSLLLIFRDAVYFWSTVNGLGVLLTVLSWNGHLYRYFPSGISAYTWPLSAVLPMFGIFAYLKFCSEFLTISRYSVLAMHALRWTGFISLFNIVLFALGQIAPAVWSSSFVGLLAPVVVYFAGYTALRSGYLPAKYFLAGFSALTIASFVVAASNIGIVSLPHRHEVTLLGGILESMFFCWAQVARIMRLQQLSGVSTRASNGANDLARRQILGSDGAQEEMWEGAAKSAILNGMRSAVLALKLDVDDKTLVNEAKTKLNEHLAALIASELNQDESSYRNRDGRTFILFTGVVSSDVLAARVEYLMEAIDHGLSSLSSDKLLSVGISLYPGDGGNLNLLRSKATEALLFVTERGGNGYAFYDEIARKSSGRS